MPIQPPPPMWSPDRASPAPRPGPWRRPRPWEYVDEGAAGQRRRNRHSRPSYARTSAGIRESRRAELAGSWPGRPLSSLSQAPPRPDARD
uniref:Uncharacterized protein n=1 Tax=Arundo donax TaxID=35708 RepID=A0A0A9ASK7_ARUDO